MLVIDYSNNTEQPNDFEIGFPRSITMTFEADEEMGIVQFIDRFRQFLKAFGFDDVLISKGMLETVYDLEINSDKDWIRDFLIEQGESGIMTREQVKESFDEE